MKQFSTNPWCLLLLRCALAAVFIYAGSVKIMAPQNFADSIASFQILPRFLLSIAALTLPPFEILAGCLLLTVRFKRQAAATIFGLMIVFAIALAQTLIRGLQVDCGCFGSHQPASLSLGRSLLILGLSGWLCRASSKENSWRSSTPNSNFAEPQHIENAQRYPTSNKPQSI